MPEPQHLAQVSKPHNFNKNAIFPESDLSDRYDHLLRFRVATNGTSIQIVLHHHKKKQ